MRNRKLITGLLCACAVLSHASAADKRKLIEEELIGVPRPELAARVLELIRHTPAHERTATAAAAIEAVSEKHPAAANSVIAAIAREEATSFSALSKPSETGNGKGSGKDKDEQGSSGQGQGNSGNGNSGSGNSGNGNSGNGNSGNGNGNNGGGRGNGLGGVGHGPGPDKPGAPVTPKPVSSILPNGKPRHFPPDPPRRPVDPPRPHQYNKPRQH